MTVNYYLTKNLAADTSNYFVRKNKLRHHRGKRERKVFKNRRKRGKN